MRAETVVAVLCLSSVGCRPMAPSPEATPTPGSALQAAEALEVSMQSMPRQVVLAVDMVGSFEQHPVALDRLLEAVAGTGFVRASDPMGEYPMDPDTVAPDRLEWRLMVPINGDIRAADPYVIDTIPASDVLVVESTVARSHEAGLALKIWTLDRGLVQTGPTRMRFLLPLTHDPVTDRVRIVFPVQRRESFGRTEAAGR